MSRIKTIVAVAMALGFVSVAVGADKPIKLRVLLLSGNNNHNWKKTTPALVKIFKESERFTVTVTNEPEKLKAADFKACDVIVSNWTPWPNIRKRFWDAETEKAFLDFIRGGRGLVVFHAASTAFATWPEFQKLVGATWGKGTGHGRQHEFEVKIADPKHPVTAGMKNFKIFDELWHRMAAQPDKKVLCTAFSAKNRGGSGAEEPVVIYTQIGKGRGFNLVLGHGTKAMSNPNWQKLMLRGTEWAATGKVKPPPAKKVARLADNTTATSTPLPAILPAVVSAGAEADAAIKAIGTYKFGQSRSTLVAVQKVVQAAAGDTAARKQMAEKLAAVLGSDVTPDCKKFVCGQLSLVAGDAQVPVLAGLLGDKDLSMAARSALQRIPGDAPLAAMRSALAKAKGPAKAGLISSLGERRDPKAVDAIAPSLTADDPLAAGAAIDALGKIGGTQATDALWAARAKVPAKLQRWLGDALLRCANGLLADGKTDRAAPIFQELSASNRPKHMRLAAFPGLVACSKDAADTVMAALTGKDPAMQLAAVRAVRLGRDEKLVQALAGQLPKVAPSVRAVVIETLAERRATSALPAIAKEASSENSAVRLAAVAALGKLGDASTVPLLAKLAAEKQGAEQRLARLSLSRLRGEGVAKAMTDQLKTADAPVRREVIGALAERGVKSAAPALLPAARDKDKSVRAEAVKALGKLADAGMCPAVIRLLQQAASDGERSALETALITICRRAGGQDAATTHVLPAMSGADAKTTGSLLRVLGKFGGPKALAAIRTGAKDKNADVRTAAILALGEWPDATPLEELLSLAASAKETVPRVLALRAFVKLSGKATDRKPDAMAGLYAKAMAVAGRPDEKKAILAGLAGLRSLKALELAESCMKESAVADEAALAAVKVADSLWVSQPQAVGAALKRIAASKVAAPIRAEATRILIELSKPVNLARDAKATSPDGLESDGNASGDQAAIDGKEDTYWDEADGRKLYRLVVTFPAPRKIAALRITGFQQHSYAPKDFEIICDGKVVKSIRNAQYQNNRMTAAFGETTCKAVELKITGYYGNSPAIRELEIYGLDTDKKEE